MVVFLPAQGRDKTKGGHYVCVKLLGGNWFVYSDQDIFLMDSFLSVPCNIYLAFYRRDSNLVQTEHAGLHASQYFSPPKKFWESFFAPPPIPRSKRPRKNPSYTRGRGRSGKGKGRGRGKAAVQKPQGSWSPMHAKFVQATPPSNFTQKRSLQPKLINTDNGDDVEESPPKKPESDPEYLPSPGTTTSDEPEEAGVRDTTMHGKSSLLLFTFISLIVHLSSLLA